MSQPPGPCAGRPAIVHEAQVRDLHAVAFEHQVVDRHRCQRRHSMLEAHLGVESGSQVWEAIAITISQRA